MPGGGIISSALARLNGLWKGDRDTHHFREEATRLLPAHSSDIPPSAFPAKEVTKVALRLK